MEALLSLAEQKTRQRWLFLRIKIPAYLCAFLYFLAFIALVITGTNVAYEFGRLCGNALFVWTVMYTIYHCVYLKFGTKVLMLDLITYLLTSIFFISMSILVISKHGLTGILIMIPAIYTLSISYLELKLRKINKKYQGFVTQRRPEYNEALAVFEQAANLQELEEAFHNHFKQIDNDNSRTRYIIGEAYIDRKKQLESIS